MTDMIHASPVDICSLLFSPKRRGIEGLVHRSSAALRFLCANAEGRKDGQAGKPSEKDVCDCYGTP
jgi:hypothetical protein